MKKHFLLALMATSLPFVAWADELTVELAQKPVIYDGKQTPELKVTKNGTELQAGEYEVKFNGQDYVYGVGEYTATVTGQGNYANDSGTLTFTVEKKDLTVTTSALSKTYGTPDNEVEIEYSASGFVLGENIYNVEIKGLKFERLGDISPETENVGSYPIALTQGATADNYNIKVTGTSMLRIYPKELNVTFSGLEWTYGETEEKYDLISVTGDGYVYEDDDESVELGWELRTNTKSDVHNAGTYSVKPTIKSNNYTLVDPNKFIDIAKAELTVTGKDMTKIYGQNDPAFEAENVTGWKYNDGETCSVILTRTNKGEDVNVYEIDGCEVSGSQNYTTVYTRNAYTLTINPKNLTDTDITFAVDDKEYQGQAAYFDLQAITVTYGNRQIAGSKDLTETTDYTFDYTEAKNAGEKVTVTVTAASNGNYTGTANFDFEIKKAPLALTVTGTSIVFDAGTTTYSYILQVLANDCQVTAQTLKNGDNVTDLGIVYSLKENEPISIGKHDIIIEATSEIAKNYTITYNKGGELAITSTDNEITIGRGIANTAQLLEAFNGYEADQNGFTVIVKESRTLNANQWYTMVLPFDISARDFASVAGYAVIDTPDESNTDAGTISFKLNMGIIEANTPFIFKIDEKRDLSSKPFIFNLQGSDAIGNGNVVIDYDAEPAVEDKAGNIYHGVYANTVISENGLWYLSSGKFYNAGATYEKYGQAVTINTLGGYVETASKANNIRILIEDVDGSVTAIDAVTGDTIYDAESWYTINGVKLNAAPTEKGIYINNGKKVFIK